MPLKRKCAAPKRKSGKMKKSKIRRIEEPVEEWLLKDLDLINDLNYDFFRSFYERTKYLVQMGRFVEAGHMKRTADILFAVHQSYVENVDLLKQNKQQINYTDVPFNIIANSSEFLTTASKSGHFENECKSSELNQKLNQEEKALTLIVEPQKVQINIDKEDLEILLKYKHMILKEKYSDGVDISNLVERLQLQKNDAHTLESENKTLEKYVKKANLTLKMLTMENNSEQMKSVNLALELVDQRIKNNKIMKEMEGVCQKLRKAYTDYKPKEIDLSKLRNENSVVLEKLEAHESELTAILEQKNDLENNFKGLKQLHKTRIELDASRKKNKFLNMRAKHSLSTCSHQAQSCQNNLCKLINPIAKSRTKKLCHTIVDQSKIIDSLQCHIEKINGQLNEAADTIKTVDSDYQKKFQDVQVLQQNKSSADIQDQVDRIIKKSVQFTKKLNSLETVVGVRNSRINFLEKLMYNCNEECKNLRSWREKFVQEYRNKLILLKTKFLSIIDRKNYLENLFERVNMDIGVVKQKLETAQWSLIQERKQLNFCSNESKILKKDIILLRRERDYFSTILVHTDNVRLGNQKQQENVLRKNWCKENNSFDSISPSTEDTDSTISADLIRKVKAVEYRMMLKEIVASDFWIRFNAAIKSDTQSTDQESSV